MHVVALLCKKNEKLLESVDSLICVSLAFDLVESLVAYEQRRFTVFHLKKLLIEVLENYLSESRT